MNLADRLNQALAARNLSVKPQNPAPEPAEVVFESLGQDTIDSVAENIEEDDDQSVDESPQVEEVTLGSLTEALTQATSAEPDEFGTRIILVKEVDLEDMHLPQAHGDFIIDDIQKRNNGIYEVHLVENNQK